MIRDPVLPGDAVWFLLEVLAWSNTDYIDDAYRP
jgi:hypothetical protein